MTRVLVCGGRDLSAAAVFNWLENCGLAEAESELNITISKFSALIHGGARGADEGAAEWGRSEDIPVLGFQADWKKHGKSAGPIRNRRMLAEGKPDVVIAFAGGRGTADMVRQARAAGIPVVRAV